MDEINDTQTDLFEDLNAHGAESPADASETSTAQPSGIPAASDIPSGYCVQTPPAENQVSPDSTVKAADPVTPLAVTGLRNGNVEPLRRRVILPVNPDTFSLPDDLRAEDVTSGRIISYARERSGISLREAADATKIRYEYIVSLENDETRGLPAHAFVIAYIRRLGELYGLDTEGMRLLQSRLRKPEEKSNVQSVIIKEMEQEAVVSEAEDRRVRRMVYVALAIVLVLLIAGAWAVIAAVVSFRSEAESEAVFVEPHEVAPVAEAPAAGFDQAQLETLIAPQMPEPTLLDFKAEPSVRK